MREASRTVPELVPIIDSSAPTVTSTAPAGPSRTAAAARRYAVPADSILLLVGDRSKIEAGLRELAIGDVVVLDEEGKPVG